MKGSKVIATVIAVMLLSVMIPTVMGAPITDEAISDSEQKIDHMQFTDKPVKIFTNESSNSFSSKLSKYTSNVEKVDDLLEISNTLSADTMIVFDNDWISDKDVTTIEKNVDKLIKNGNPVVIIDSDPQLLLETGRDLGFTSFADSAQVYAMWYSPQTGAQSCCSIGGYADNAEAIAAAYEWANETILLNSTTSASEDLGPAHDSFFSEVCGDYGVMSSRTTYHKILGDNDPNRDYYLAHYRFEANPNDNHSKATMDINCDVDKNNSNQILFTYYPQTTVGTTTVGADISAALEASGSGFSAGISVGANWSYSVPDVIVRNGSDLASNYYHVWHDINECTNSGYDTTLVEPGMVIRVDSNLGECHNEDTYKVQFCDVVIHGKWHNNFKDFTKTISVDIYE